jgi:HD-GYP domain-containing protein (c-di-GMP phosphodiesterase class II)
LKSGAAFAIFHRPGVDLKGLGQVIADLGLDLRELRSNDQPEGPSLLILENGRRPPTAWRDNSAQLPLEGPPDLLGRLLRMAMENAVLRAESRQRQEQFKELNRIGIALSSERDLDALQDLVLRTCRQLTRADGASLYLVEEGSEGDRVLRFAWSQSHSLRAPYRAFTIPLNEKSMAGYTVLSGRSLVIEDAYALQPTAPFGFGGVELDEQYGYRTRSILGVPMRNHSGEVVGAIQLINRKRDFATTLTRQNVESEVTSFAEEDLGMIESIASQAAVALENRKLLEAIQALFEGFVQASVTAIESRDPTTYGHSGRVAALTVGLAEAISAIAAGPYTAIRFDADQLREIRYAALLHDFGKVGVREHVLVKEKKLYPADLKLIRARFVFVQRSAQLAATEEKLRLSMSGKASAEDFGEIDASLFKQLAELRDWLQVVVAANEPTILEEDSAGLLELLAERRYEDLDREQRPLLQPEEFHFLNIRRGTLDEAERREIESHVTHSFRFLTKIPWTPAMRAVPQIAYGHHELLDGTGYPRHLAGDEIPVQTRMMTIADIYDALTAQDRPYKRAIPTDRALQILRMEASANKLDGALLDVFIEHQIFKAAADYRPDRDLLMGMSGRP